MADLATPGGHHRWPADGNCANCGAGLLGNWCHACGQRGADHHRSLRHLAAEAIESLTHADGRLWRTLRLLLIAPGRLTRDYLQGRRASEVPPLRLFFVTLLVVFASRVLLGRIHWDVALSPHQMEQARSVLGHVDSGARSAFSAWLRLHLLAAIENPNALLAGIGEWAERFTILLLPLSALVLRMLFPWRRDLKLYDHLIFTMHALSFVGFVFIAVLLLAKVARLPSPYPALPLLALPVHLFVHMRGVYRTGVLSTLWRMWLLAWCTCGVLLVLLAGLAAVSLSTLES